jgi:hypothetical protein
MMFVYWNAVNNAAFCFMSKFKYPGGMIYMSRQFYNLLENEMIGDQWWFLIKENSVRGMKIVIDDSQELFTIRGSGDDEIVVTDMNVTKFSQF